MLVILVNNYYDSFVIASLHPLLIYDHQNLYTHTLLSDVTLLTVE